MNFNGSPITHVMIQIYKLLPLNTCTLLQKHICKQIAQKHSKWAFLGQLKDFYFFFFTILALYLACAYEVEC